MLCYNLRFNGSCLSETDRYTRCLSFSLSILITRLTGTSPPKIINTFFNPRPIRYVLWQTRFPSIYMHPREGNYNLTYSK